MAPESYFAEIQDEEWQVANFFFKESNGSATYIMLANFLE